MICKTFCLNYCHLVIVVRIFGIVIVSFSSPRLRWWFTHHCVVRILSMTWSLNVVSIQSESLTPIVRKWSRFVILPLFVHFVCTWDRETNGCYISTSELLCWMFEFVCTPPWKRSCVICLPLNLCSNRGLIIARLIFDVPRSHGLLVWRCTNCDELNSIAPDLSSACLQMLYCTF